MPLKWQILIQTNLQQTNVNSKPSCCAVNEHMGNSLSIMLNKDDMRNKNVSIDQCMSGMNISNCVSKFDQNKITSPSKSKARHIRKLPVWSRHALFNNVCTQKLITDSPATGCHLRHHDPELKCIRDVYCPKKVDVKFYICECILAGIFYLPGPTSDLYAQQVYRNVNHLNNVCQSTLYTDIETNPGQHWSTHDVQHDIRPVHKWPLLWTHSFQSLRIILLKYDNFLPL